MVFNLIIKFLSLFVFWLYLIQKPTYTCAGATRIQTRVSGPPIVLGDQKSSNSLEPEIPFLKANIVPKSNSSITQFCWKKPIKVEQFLSVFLAKTVKTRRVLPIA